MADLSKRLAELSPEKRELVLKKLRKQNLIPEKNKRLQAPPIIPVPRDQTIPLSFAQERLWFLSQLEEARAVYNMPAALRLTGTLNRMALERSINEIICRHETLRTTFVMEDGHPVQVIAPALSLPVPVMDLQQLPEVEQSAEVQRLAADEAQRPFDLSKGPLLRVTLLQLAEEEHVLLLTMHHIISDGWSIGIFIREVVALYEAFLTEADSPLPELPIQYADFAQWQRNWLQGEILERQLSYWKKQLAGDLPVLELPTDRPRPVRLTFQGTTQTVVLSKTLSDAIKILSQQEKVTLFMLLLAAFKTLLYRYTTQNDIIIGTAFANRNRAEIETLIGFFVNTLVLRTKLSENPTFRELLEQVRETILEAQEHQDMPFEQLVTELRPERELSRQPLFQVMFVLQNAPMQALKLPGLTLSPMELYTETAKFDLTLVMEDTEQGLKGALEYNTDLFDDATITRMIGHFRTLLEGVVANPEQRLSELPILTEAERHQILVEWNDTTTDYPKDRCIHELFEAQAEYTPDAVALAFEDQQLSYHELNSRANQLAHYLRKLGVGPEVLVGICLERSLEMIVALLGILKAGGAYMPLDVDYPQERLIFMLEDARVPVLLTQQRFVKELPLSEINIVCLDSEWGKISLESKENLISRVTANNLAYVMYTSGSTGKPKGISVIHRGVIRLVKETNYVDLTPEEVFLQFAPISFDASTFEIWGCLLNGARLVVMSAHKPSLQELGQIIQRYQITTLWLTAGLFHLMVEQQLEDLKPVRQLLAGGDVLSVPHVRKALQVLRGGKLINGYGPTENTTFTCCFTITESDQKETSIPIGRPIANTQVYILDHHLQPVPIGVPGELYIGGDGLARDYLNRPDLTTEKFIPDFFRKTPGARLYKTGDLTRYLKNGNIEFLGRIDHQVKIRGFRIELGEIETVLGSHQAVREAVVVVRGDVSENKQLIGYIVLYKGQRITAGDLRDFIKTQLPDYMIPATFIFMETFPLNPNGKVDRRALPAPDTITPEMTETFVAPRTSVEKALADIWADILELKQIGVYDNFFELGGHSLLVVQLISRIKEAFQVEIPVRSIFENPTVADLARTITVSCSGEISTGMSDLPVPDLQAEATLDAAIFPETIYDGNITKPSAIFLTGATGFLGAFLLHELLQKTDADIYCLVRSSTEREGKERIQKILESYTLWNKQLASRIVPVPGDLSQPLFGLSTEQFDILAHRIDVIYHNGAFVNFIYPYSALKPANVLGTQEVLRLACQTTVKPVHYVSTISVFDADSYSMKEVILEDEPLTHYKGLDTGYSQSKWVAEQLVLIACSRGLPVCIYRPGRITGHSQNGIWNTRDFACSMLKGCIQLGSVPEMNVMVDMTPVDYVSQAIVYLSKQQASLEKIFHLINPRPLHWNNLINWICSFGYSVQQIPYDQWQKTLTSFVTKHPQENVLQPFLPMFPESGMNPYEQEAQRFDSQNTLAGLTGTSIVCPPVDDALLHTYFSYFIQSGFLPAL